MYAVTFTGRKKLLKYNSMKSIPISSIRIPPKKLWEKGLKNSKILFSLSDTHFSYKKIYIIYSCTLQTSSSDYVLLLLLVLLYLNLTNDLFYY